MEFKDTLQDVKYLTRKNYTSQVNNFLKRRQPINQVSIYLLENPVAIRKVSIIRYLNFLKANNYNVDDLIERVSKIKTPEKDRKYIQTLQVADGTRLVNHLLDKNKIDLALICMIAMDTGARIRAIIKLRKTDVVKKIDGNTYLILREKRDRVIERVITESTERWLGIFLGQMKTKSSYLFFRSEKVTNEGLDKRYYQLWKQLKNNSRPLFGQGVSFHWIRRGAGTEAYENTGKDLVAVSEFYGHKDPSVTRKYLRLQGEKVSEIIKHTNRDW